MGAESSTIAVYGDELEKQFSKEVEPDESTLQFVRRSYTNIVRRIVQPERHKYKRSALGPEQFVFADIPWQKTEFTVTTDDGIALKAVRWDPFERVPHSPVIVYLHSASCAMDDSVEALFVCARLKTPLVSFDFRCCGQSDGPHVSFDMRVDLCAVLDFIQSTYPSCPLVLWGKGTGAAAAMQYLSTDAMEYRTLISALVLDSPFKSVDAMVADAVRRIQSQGYWIPSAVMKLGFNIVRSSIRQHTAQDPYSIKPIEYAQHCHAPACVLISTGDEYVSSKQSLEVVNAYRGPTVTLLIETTHFDRRPVSAILGVQQFIASRCNLQCVPGVEPRPHEFTVPWEG